ncbi:MAG: hypothetical protein LC114_23075 [Bryobacterales bacterium]|nr:hypothetical protein [Bryobacterales bacterium]HMN15260.1 hypothetical protein [Bellilinea sp.]
MFEGIKSFIRDIRIKFDYPRYEKESLAAHRAEAECRFDIGQLQIEVSTIKLQAELTGDQRFGAEITPLRRQIAVLEQESNRIRGQQAILERDYKSELDELYARKKQLIETNEELFAEMKRLQAERSQAHDDLKEAYEDLDDAKDDVDRWYSKSERTPWLFGNGGRKLPKHSPFGQSFGDLEAAKSRRGDAAHEIGECKGRIADIRARQAENKREREQNRAEIGRVSDKIAAVKAARQRMLDLKNEGVQQGPLRQKLRECLSSQADFENQLLVLESQRSALVEETECRLGLREREAAIADLVARKARFMDEFHSEQSKAARLDHHRRQWLAKRG